MARTVADFMLHRLAQWGIRRIYGYPGDGINGIMGALGRAKGEFQFIGLPLKWRGGTGSPIRAVAVFH